jgi:hypothetical protein
MTNCKWCHQDIFWTQRDQQWIPYDDEARTIPHDCPNKPTGSSRPPSAPTAPATSDTAKKIKADPLTDEEIIFVRKFHHFCKELATK